jgi:uncharacterized membrane protein YfcA
MSPNYTATSTIMSRVIQSLISLPWEKMIDVGIQVGFVAGAVVGGAIGAQLGYRVENQARCKDRTKQLSETLLGGCCGMVVGSTTGVGCGIVAAGAPIWGLPVLAGVAIEEYTCGKNKS